MFRFFPFFYVLAWKLQKKIQTHITKKCLKTVTSVVADEWNARTTAPQPLIFHDSMIHRTIQITPQPLACTQTHHIATAIQIQRE